MIILKHIYRFANLLFILAIIVFATSCKNKQTSPSEYLKGISEIAAQYDTKCPIDQGNGTRLESVTLEDRTLIFRLSLSDEAITTVNLDNTRDSIIHNMSSKLKKYLIKGRCKLIYKYVSPHDSSYVEIIPKELENSLQKEK